MTEALLRERSNGRCELCSSDQSLGVYEVAPRSGEEGGVLVCAICQERMHTADGSNHWYCLRDSVWSEHAAVKVLSYRILKGLNGQSWAQELLSQMYLDDDTQQWADALAGDDDGDTQAVRDSNGSVLQEGDTVTLIKDLEVKGANFTAKRGTSVKGINLTDDPKYVEGRVNGVRIVLVAAYLKKV